MAIIKKKDILKHQAMAHIVEGKKKKQKQIVSDEAEPLEELVDADGSPIEGNSKNLAANSEVETAPQQTTDDYVQSAIQPTNDLYGVSGTPYSRGSRGGNYINAGYVRNKVLEILKEGKNNA